MIKKIAELLTRLTISAVFIESGWGKIHNITKVVSYFESLKIPFAAIQAPLVSYVELIAGLMILFGFYTRLASVSLIGIMSVALLTAKLDDISSVSTLVEQPEFLYIIALTWLLADGSNIVSLDRFRLKMKTLKYSA